MKLYLLEADSGKCKVGISGDVITRLKGLESSGGFKIVNLFYVELGENAYAVEQAVHKRLEECRERTSFGGRSEWFTARFTYALAAVLELVYDVGLWLDDTGGPSMWLNSEPEPSFVDSRYDNSTTGYVSLKNINFDGGGVLLGTPPVTIVAFKT